jgi:polyphosphate kinase 2 (PPK2 family)
MKATLTIPSTKTGGKASKVKLKSSTVQVTKAKKKTHTFKLTKSQRARVARALRTARTRRGVKVVVTGTARDAAGKRPVTKTKTVNVRR